jgi:DNA helicase HerA-like ATPase
MIFDFALWSARDKAQPMLLVCEEAHRYIPSDERVGFSATKIALARIAKEGRKYGVSLCLVSQRPSELSTSVLSQCGTIFALRMGNEQDQSYVGRALPENAQSLLGVLPALRQQEAIVVGEGVTVPMRVRFAELPEAQRPRRSSAAFSQLWQDDTAKLDFVEDTVRRWRQQIR